MDLRMIAEQWLIQNGYQGLMNPEMCACKVGDLMPCMEPSSHCQPGYLAPCDGECDAPPCDFHIVAKKRREEE